MKVNQEELIEEIEVAFSDVKRPKTSLRQFKITDEKGLSQEISAAEWNIAGMRCTDKIWQEISDSELEECGCQLAHMKGDEFLYYLPAFMRHSVRYYKRPIWEDSFVLCTISSLQDPTQAENYYPGLGEYILEQFSELTLKHVNVIIAYLKFIATEGDYINQPDAIRALDYWLSY
ncbi:hypothetical protein F896_03618 [Acinetobacter genomosp. 15BJ]|uniref:Uncharacterized protein n=1 Tax=Acinetobacter genomosp. 15BJ TaxID=106651 RepID=R9ATU9_9GAMM|nr:hypothetical protein F896_03618 [Acinetobacter genomosp. 15BJ]